MFCLSVISVTQSCPGFCLSLMTSCNNLLLNLSLWLQQKIESAQQIPTRHLISSGWGQNMGTICTCHSPTRYNIKWPPHHHYHHHYHNHHHHRGRSWFLTWSEANFANFNILREIIFYHLIILNLMYIWNLPHLLKE